MKDKDLIEILYDLKNKVKLMKENINVMIMFIDLIIENKEN
tara:strand:- start:531 stop:653 length:123 start_codon:yes stop_codon:yes gene_type:complete